MTSLPAVIGNGTSTESRKWVAQFNRSLGKARKAIVRRRTLALAVATVAMPVTLSALWVALVRFTLVDVPEWPVLLFPLLWLCLLLIARRTQHVSLGESARFLDHSLGLDE